jgi:hypothetical protein
MKCLYKPAPAKQKNDINHAIKRRLASTINNIFPAFKPIYKRVLGLFNNNMVVVDECPKTTCANSKQKSRIHMQEHKYEVMKHNMSARGCRI